jgi:hypothetical protein
MSLNPTKSIFGVIACNIIGHIFSNSGINIDPRRVTTIQNLQALFSKKQI